MMESGWNALIRAWPQLLDGLLFSVGLAIFSSIGGLLLGIGLSILRLSGFRPLVWFAWAYVTLFRCVPLIMVIFWFYLLMPLIMQTLTGARFPVPIGPVYSALITFTVFEAAFYSEAIRAGINSLPRGQWEAARSLCLGPADLYRYVILPQAIRRMLPILVTQTIILFQDTSLVYVLTLPDFVGVAARIGQREGELAFFYIFIAVIFFLISYSLSRLVRWLENRAGLAQH
jgi:glutamate/aspartate transport system permease protein